MTKRLIVILCLELFFSVVITTGICLKRPQYAHAFREWGLNPNPQTEAEYFRQRKIATTRVFVANTLVFGAVLLITLSVARRKSVPQNPAAGENKPS